MDENKCTVSPEYDCKVQHKVEEFAGDLKALKDRMEDYNKKTSDSIVDQGRRIGNLEIKDAVIQGSIDMLKSKIDDISSDMKTSREETKSSITDLRMEHKESMVELKKGNKDILDALSPLKHKVESLERLGTEIDEMKSKPGKRWEKIVESIIGLVVAAVVGFMLAQIGFK